MTRPDTLTLLVRAIVLITALPVHECAHGWASSKLGDNTARHMGRLTLNPFSHLDFMGSFLLLFAGFGWAKPVPVDSRYFKNPRRDMALTALAGPLSNVMMALVVLIFYKVVLSVAYVPAARSLSSSLPVILQVLLIMILVNLRLAVFNLLPIPPLDGSKILNAVLPEKFYYTVLRNERYMFLLVFVLLMTGVLDTPLQFLADLLLQALLFLTKPIDLLLGL